MLPEFIDIALEEARTAYKKNEIPVGCVIVAADDTLLAQSHNRVEELQDVTAHAELLAIKAATRHIGEKHLDACSIYVTLEPCAMCAAAISAARIEKLYFGAYDAKSGGVEHGARVFSHKTCHHKPEIYGGIEEEKCKLLMQQFFQDIRKIKNV